MLYFLDDTESDEENEFDNVIIKFSTDPDLLDDECQNLLKHYGKHLCDRKIMLQLFVKYAFSGLIVHFHTHIQCMYFGTL